MTLSYKSTRRIGILTLLTIILVIGLYSYLTMRKVSNETEQILKIESARFQNYREITLALYSINNIFYKYYFDETDNIDELKSLIEKAAELVNNLKHSAQNKAESDKIELIHKNIRLIKTTTYAYELGIKEGLTGSTGRDMELHLRTAVNEAAYICGLLENELLELIKKREIQLLDDSARAKNFLAVVIFFGIVLSIIISIILSKALAKPIDLLVSGAKLISAGNFTCKINIHSNDEIGTLAKAFNMMTSDLQQTHTELDNLNKNLELKVIEKTEELTRSNEELQQTNEELNTSNEELETTIEELNQTNSELEHQKLRAEQAERAKSEFLANMSHEIRTPMNAILGFSEILAEKELESDELEYVKLINDSGEHLLKVINDILDFSKIEAGKLEIDIIQFSIYELIESVYNIFKNKAEEKKISLRRYINDNVPEYFFGDKTRIYQILSNLTSNAIKFTESGGVKILCSFNSGKLIFEIEDTGIGMTEPQIKKIFQPFTQADSSTTRKYGGTGLGVTIVSKLTQLMGGELEVQSQADAGTKFTVKLPIQIADDINFSKTNHADSFEKGRILIIEDDVNAQQILTNIFEKENFSVRINDTGKRVINDIENYNPQLLILDIKFSDADGLDIMSQIKSNPLSAPLPVIVCSGISNVEKTTNFGAFDYIKKPVRPAVLLNSVNRALSSKVSGSKIFIIENDKRELDKIKNLLFNGGYSSFSFSDANSALDLIAEKRIIPDIIIIDIVMLETEGTEFIRSLNEMLPDNNIPLLINSDIDISSDELKKMGVAAAELIQKNSNERTDLLKIINKIYANESHVNINGKSGVHKRPKKATPPEIIDRYYTDFIDDPDMREIYLLALNDLAQMETKFLEYFNERKFDDLGRLVHTKKGTTGSLNILHFFDLLNEIDLFIKSKKYSADEAALFVMIDKLTKMIAEIPDDIVKRVNRKNVKDENKRTVPAAPVFLKLTKKFNILIAEDNLVNRKFIGVLLKSHSDVFNTFFAEHGKEALEILEKNQIDLVLMDIQMPVMDGIETTKIIRANKIYDKIPVIALTAHAMKGDRERFINIGCNDYLPKPLKKKDLIATLEKYLEC